jgi:hypothetical protein
MTENQKKALANSYSKHDGGRLYLGKCSAVDVRALNEAGYVAYHDHPTLLTKKGLRALAELGAPQ